jgi:TonB family protein
MVSYAQENNEISEVLPSFPGGTGALSAFFTSNMKYPVTAQEAGIQGRVIVRFKVNTDGSIKDATVVRSVSPELDAEALRIVGAMPKWNPGMQHGKPVYTYFTMPITFNLMGDSPRPQKSATHEATNKEVAPKYNKTYAPSEGKEYWSESFKIVSSTTLREGAVTLEKKLNFGDFRVNPDGWKFYRTTLALGIVSNGEKQLNVIETDIYTLSNYGINMLPCMLIDPDKNIITIFSNSKTSDLNNYGMDGFVYRIDLNSKQWKKETVFTSANHGWYSFFGGSDNGNPELYHFSFAGYYAMLSKRNTAGNWSSRNIGYMRPESAESQYTSHKNILVTSYPNADRMSLKDNNYASNSSTTSSSFYVDDKTLGYGVALVGTAAIMYGIYKLFSGGRSNSGSYSSSSSYSSDDDSYSSRTDDSFRDIPRESTNTENTPQYIGVKNRGAWGQTTETMDGTITEKCLITFNNGKTGYIKRTYYKGNPDKKSYWADCPDGVRGMSSNKDKAEKWLDVYKNQNQTAYSKYIDNN